MAAIAGTISFGALLGALYIGQQFTQNVLGYDTSQAAATTIAVLVVVIALVCVLVKYPRKHEEDSTFAAIAAQNLARADAKPHERH